MCDRVSSNSSNSFDRSVLPNDSFVCAFDNYSCVVGFESIIVHFSYEICCDLPRKTDQESAACLCADTFSQAIVSNDSVIDELRTVDHWEVVDDDIDLLLLHLSQELTVSFDAESSDVSACVSAVFLHEMSPNDVECAHFSLCFLECFDDIFRGYQVSDLRILLLTEAC